ncbi:tRNA uracil 4-sulfurtransferase ThiI [Cellvibrio japonicus]|uniref:tRNA sulfurtransferase n=1 Tax=Cellvibrio japonicus (strain Ueda107) TaxID=498211 RepID=B3PG77_CELJU|nr:tRNA uracil 4-sulfurtransferase ThiI [Cellvibrio japonicus]ACE82659.1 thiazole biosynthesis protein ThiI [Cellvibrio japonicus Ueda107]QEI13749.1 tRNA 4-thiouridine(8) synthase ThiI [Cellvibrio japonicus]QEI17323.1 tRNA 4-thiouridine(8) synthase ThiI [Cellvibrio japonicus]QEI20900.1 tRNA 4-thiouridine(8) synthase ThiI [Cellvibrio japonicus]
MHFIVKVFPEIIIKSPPVRKRFIKQLRDNLRVLLNNLGVSIDVQRDWEKIEIRCPEADELITAQVSEVLAHTPGIANFALIQDYPLADLESIFRHTLRHWGDALAGKRFCVRVKRAGKHEFTSVQVEQYVGGGLLEHTRAAGVDLHHPEVTVPLEIKGERLWVITRKTQGLGGFPLGAQDPVLSLISGGFDSTVSTYLCIKRGLRAHYCFFNLGGRAHEIGVKEVAYYLWNKYGASHRVKFVTVPFEEVVREILEKVDNAYMGVTLKRMMLRAAEKVAESLEIPALVTGESVAQVSSQTLINLNAIDRAIDMLVLRPLATMDKGDIIDISRKIGTESFAASMPEYCGVISVNPTTKARMHKVEREEAKFDMAILERAIAERRAQNIDEIVEELDQDLAVPVVDVVQPGQALIDIRHPDEEEANPLRVSGVDILKIPFYRLNNQFAQLDTGKQYFLYCQKGVMSQLHAANLKDAGHTNVGVYRPEPRSACAI